jgi:hypothetical protein
MRCCLLIAISVGGAARAAAGPVSVQSHGFTAQLERGALTSLKDAHGNVFVGGEPLQRGLAIRRVGGDFWAHDDGAPATLKGEETVAQTYSQFPDMAGASVRVAYRLDPASGDLIASQEAKPPEAGVWGVEWEVGYIPLDMSILVPGNSGLKLSADSPGNQWSFEYPISWEAQLVVVEGRGRGFYVFADDAQGRFKRLTVTRSQQGWQLGLATINYAPFDPLTECNSVAWRLNVYEGDWRVPARRYRDWMAANLRPTRVADQQPAWVKDIRCVVIMGMEIPVIEALAERLDPRQTLLYIPGWRKPGYDRDYPNYADVVPEWEPFVRRAHELGYRVMPHVNYFGVDPLNELYAQFEPYQVRSPWGNHDKQWWLWERADPVIKFAYINPACKAFRELFVARMKELCERYQVDALHLDQTLCIFNDNNGLVDGMSMLQGNLALHRDLREALPQVALSGEGLDEITCVHEAFAQRHVYGLNHADGTWNRSYLDMAHPISSYLLRPYTIMYGYLGCAPPTSGQMYAAWNEAYEHWGVIPTLKPDLAQIANPTGFSHQFFDEANVWLGQRLGPDMDGDWPATVAFPFRTASGERAVRTADHRLMWGDREVSRTITNVTEVKLPGSIPGWRAYDAHRLFGLLPESWYPYLAEPRDMDAFHVEGLPEGFRCAQIIPQTDMAYIRTEQTGGIVADLPALLNKATCGSIPFEGEAVEVTGPLQAEDGSHFLADGTTMRAHPPWKAKRRNPATNAIEANGTGIAYARYGTKLPAKGKLRFISGVALDKGAVGQENADGVTFGVNVRAGDTEDKAEVHNATAEPRELTLDLAKFAGKDVELELTVDPGPERNPSYDWARWYWPRVEQDIATTGDLIVGGKQTWNLALSGTHVSTPRAEGGRYRLAADFPGGVILLSNAKPQPVQLPLDVASAALRVSFVSEEGQVLASPQYAGAVPVADQSVGGVSRNGLSAHPPDHGQTIASLLLDLPTQPAEFHSFIGLRDGSKSEGCVFLVEANGTQLVRERILPGEWHEVAADLALWAGKTVMLSLTTDSDGPHYYDWAVWGEPLLRAK